MATAALGALDFLLNVIFTVFRKIVKWSFIGGALGALAVLTIYLIVSSLFR